MSETRLDWNKLFSGTRFRSLLDVPKPSGMPPRPVELSFLNGKQFRTEQERDHDRVLFSTPFRRLGDKTQVFPLESNESIRTRLTHSFEVANLARSIGLELAEHYGDDITNGKRNLPAMLACVGLAHDIGNPPFGHQGEYAIRAWFERNEGPLFDPTHCDRSNAMKEDLNQLTKQHKNDFLKFEGNAQTLRVLTKLQVMADDLGLNLTVGSLTAVMKYIAASDELDEKVQAKKKVGYFASEQGLVAMMREETGLDGDARHPLALVMEACDDIAYSVMDAEDAIKKGIVSLNDLIASLEYVSSGGDDEADEGHLLIRHVCEVTRWELGELRKQTKLHPSELQDVATQKFRVYAIHVMVSAIVEAFKKHYNTIMSGTFSGELVKVSQAGNLCKALKTFDRENAFSHREVLAVELKGYNTLNRLMDYLWMGISQRTEYLDLASARNSPFSAYVYSRISKNYKRIFEGAVNKHHKDPALPIRYREMQLLTDMVSGMTDQFCIDLHNEFDHHFREMHKVNG